MRKESICLKSSFFPSEQQQDIAGAISPAAAQGFPETGSGSSTGAAGGGRGGEGGRQAPGRGPAPGRRRQSRVPPPSNKSLI